MESPSDDQTRIGWLLHCNVTRGDSLQNNSFSELSAELGNESHLRARMRWIKDITFWFIIVTVAVTVCS